MPGRSMPADKLRKTFNVTDEVNAAEAALPCR
jgi:hypothetical protein